MSKVELRRNNQANAYLKIRTGNNYVLAAGNQSWWKEEALSQRDLNFRDFRSDINYRMWRMGCGVIAMCDMVLFLESQRIQKGDDTEGIDREDYRKRVRETAAKWFPMGKGYLSYIIGLFPAVMERGLRKFYRENGQKVPRIRWAPYWWQGKKQRQKLLPEMERMLTKGIPVVFSYHSFQGDKLMLYRDAEAAFADLGDSRVTTNSHYMTIIGIERKDADEAGETKVALQVLSWGNIYYVSYNSLGNRWNYFTNILQVGED